MNMLLFNGKPVCVPEAKFLFFELFLTAITFGERGILSLRMVGYYSYNMKIFFENSLIAVSCQ